MRIFNWYSFNIAEKTQFKDAKPYLDAMLSDLGFSYDRLVFSFGGDEKNVEKALKKFPALEKYFIIDNSHDLHSPILTSFREDWQRGNLFVDPGDEADICALISKIPVESIYIKTFWYCMGFTGLRTAQTTC